jgi:hypothetical protein
MSCMNEIPTMSRKCLLNRLVSVIGIKFVLLLFAAEALALDKSLIRMQDKSAKGTNVLLIEDLSKGTLELVRVTFSHTERVKACSFEVHSLAQRIPQKERGIYNLMLPNGANANYAEYKPSDGAIKSLDIDQRTHRRPYYAGIEINTPASYDVSKCRIKDGRLAVDFYNLPPDSGCKPTKIKDDNCDPADN